MENIAKNEQEKSQLAIEICDLVARAITCAKIHRPFQNKSPFINWYRVLRVDENADVNGVRKQYHKLALQLHPDKNKHSKAEAAFKLVSEAYYCLSDNARRAAFDCQKMTNSCIKCSPTPYTNKSPPKHTTNIKIQEPYQEKSRSNRIQKSKKELQTKLKEQANIIERCLKINARLSRKGPLNASGREEEFPIFNPSDYQHKGYPHFRTINHNKIEELRSLRLRNRCTTNNSPVFQYQSERSSFMSRCASTRDH
ncbi:hypothetical protein CDL12_18619 [Handroanthus impetiginosus]|uniref:J domain-containing protein n=1 Tax=Handroanthus impetiginosus TaxID=429701 RepID=A0A2G9GUV6_9LAMI|nr:hypothetical protein CDL12_18619 [Handroanthus impetiginosus]